MLSHDLEDHSITSFGANCLENHRSQNVVLIKDQSNNLLSDLKARDIC